MSPRHVHKVVSGLSASRPNERISDPQVVEEVQFPPSPPGPVQFSACISRSIFVFPPPPRSPPLSVCASLLLELILLNALDTHQLGLENKHTVRRDRPNGLRTVGHLRRDRQPPLLTNAHVK